MGISKIRKELNFACSGKQLVSGDTKSKLIMWAGSDVMRRYAAPHGHGYRHEGLITEGLDY